VGFAARIEATLETETPFLTWKLDIKTKKLEPTSLAALSVDKSALAKITAELEGQQQGVLLAGQPGALPKRNPDAQLAHHSGVQRAGAQRLRLAERLGNVTDMSQWVQPNAADLEVRLFRGCVFLPALHTLLHV
jgi:hypothetical protein